MLSTVEKVLFLMRAPVTADATTDGLSRLAQVAHEIEAPIGARLFAVGDAPDALYIVLDGAVRVEALSTSGTPCSRLGGPGDFVGALASFGDAPHAATATCAVTTRLLKIDRTDLHDLLDEDGELARALFTGLVRAVRALHPAALAA